MTDSLKIVFAGTPEFSVPPLSALLQTDHQVVAVYTQPDRPAGRGRKITPSAVKQLALEHEIPVFQPASLKGEEDLATLEAHQADLMIVVAYGLLLPARVLHAPRLGCINIHASLLPRWRGAAPIQRAILAGDRETGITIMQMDEGLDTGAMLLTLACPIGDTETGGSLHDKLATLGAQALMEALPGIADGSISHQTQDETAACYAAKLSKTEAILDWTQPAAQLDRRIRAFNPWPVAQTQYGTVTMRIWESRPLPTSTDQPPGTVLAHSRGEIDVATGEGVLRIEKLQLPGKRAMSAADFLNAHALDAVVFH
jgi:methionyl-tRNA formyltransferase